MREKDENATYRDYVQNSMYWMFYDLYASR